MTTASEGRPDPTDGATQPWERIAPVLAAIGASIGVLGFVTFVGGAIQFARFNGAGLPAEEALSIIPTANLVVVGARALAPAVLLALAAVAFLALGRAFLDLRADPTAMRADDKAAPGDKAAPAQAKPTLASAEKAPTRAIVRALSMAMFLGSCELLAFAFTLEGRGWQEIAAFVALAAVTVALAASIAHRTGRFLWLGTTTFVAMSVFLGGLELARASQTSDVRAAAVIRENKRAIIGFYVAETSDRVFLGRLSFKPDTENREIVPAESRLVAFQKGQISDLGIGPPVDPGEALRQAERLADELCSLQTPRATASRKKGARPRPVLNCWSKPPGVEVPGAS